MSQAQIRILIVLASLVVAMASATAAVFLLLGDDDSPDGRRVAASGGLASPTVAAASATPAGSAGRPLTPTGTITPTRTVTAGRGVTVRADGATNVRAGPGVGFAIIATLISGEEVRATGRNADASWLFVEIDGGAGWVSADVVAVAGIRPRCP